MYWYIRLVSVKISLADYLHHFRRKVLVSLVHSFSLPFMLRLWSVVGFRAQNTAGPRRWSSYEDFVGASHRSAYIFSDMTERSERASCCVSVSNRRRSGRWGTMSQREWKSVGEIFSVCALWNGCYYIMQRRQLCFAQKPTSVMKRRRRCRLRKENVGRSPWILYGELVSLRKINLDLSFSGFSSQKRRRSRE